MWLRVIVCLCLVTKVTRGLLNELDASTNQDLALLVTKLEARVSELDQQLTSLTANYTAYISRKNIHAGFMAALSNTVSGCANDQPLVFGNVRLNDGGAYDPRHGTFRAPVSGVYHFGLTLTAPTNDHFHIKIVKNSVSTEVGYLYANAETDWQIPSTSILVELKAGDDVWCKCDEASNIASGIHSHFTGFLVSVI